MRNQYAIIILAVIIVIVSGLVYYFYERPTGKFDFQKSLLDAQNLHHQGKDQEAVKMLEEKILPNTSDKKLEAVARILLAFSYFNIDPSKGISLFKEIAANEAYPKLQRAYAVSDMVDILMLGSRGPSPLADAIFSGEPYASFSKTQPSTSRRETQIFIGGKRLYQYASLFYVLPTSEYRIAEWYAKTALTAIINPKYKPVSLVSQKILDTKTHLQKGDDAFAANLAILSDTDKGYAKWVKGETLAMLAEVEKNSSYNQAAETAFKDSLNFLENSPSTKYRNSLLLWANFYYAAFLERAYGDSRTSDIKALTANMSGMINQQKSENPVGFVRYLTRIGKTSASVDTYERQNALALAKRDSNFASIIKDLGWKL